MAVPVPTKTKVWTLEELHSLPDDGNKYELVHGELFVTPPPTVDHEEIAARLDRVLFSLRRRERARLRVPATRRDSVPGLGGRAGSHGSAAPSKPGRGLGRVARSAPRRGDHLARHPAS